MNKLLVVNTTCGGSSTGRAACSLADAARGDGWSVSFAHGERYSDFRGDFMEGRFGQLAHGAYSLLADAQGLGSISATRRLIHYIYKERPDVAHLHNLHGYYINYPMLLRALAETGVCVILTLHDCWPLTGHCAYPGECQRWKQECGSCPHVSRYPRALVDRSSRNRRLKRDAFRALGDMLTVVPVSRWIEGVALESFLAPRVVEAIPNGIDLNLFTPAERPPERLTVLAAAAPFDDRKGFADVVALRRLLPDDARLVVAGLSARQLRSLPEGVEGHGVARQAEMVSLYRQASVFVSLARDDNYPTTILEAQACGIPVVAYDAGGQGEAVVSGETGLIVPAGDLAAAAAAIGVMGAEDRRGRARAHAVKNFGFALNHSRYLALYNRKQNGLSILG